MRILNYEVNRNGVVNVVKEEQRKVNLARAKQTMQSNKIREKIYRTALFRSRAGINNWIGATQQAESLIMPNNTELIRVFKDIEVDLHLLRKPPGYPRL